MQDVVVLEAHRDEANALDQRPRDALDCIALRALDPGARWKRDLVEFRQAFREALDSQNSQLDQIRAESRAVHGLMLQRLLELLRHQELLLN
jgi:hypothetical protein